MLNLNLQEFKRQTREIRQPFSGIQNLARLSTALQAGPHCASQRQSQRLLAVSFQPAASISATVAGLNAINRNNASSRVLSLGTWHQKNQEHLQNPPNFDGFELIQKWSKLQLQWQALIKLFTVITSHSTDVFVLRAYTSSTHTRLISIRFDPAKQGLESISSRFSSKVFRSSTNVSISPAIQASPHASDTLVAAEKK